MSATEIKTATAATSKTIAALFQRDPSLGQVKEKPAYRVALVCLLAVSAVFCLATAILMVAVFLPGHLGLSEWLQALGSLWPANFPIYTT